MCCAAARRNTRLFVEVIARTGDTFWGRLTGQQEVIEGSPACSLTTLRGFLSSHKLRMSQPMFPLNQPEVIIADAAHRFDEDGNLIHDPTKQLIQELLKNLVDWTRRISSAPAKLTLLEAQLMEGEIQWPETLNSPVTETSARNGAWR